MNWKDPFWYIWELCGPLSVYPSLKVDGCIWQLGTSDASAGGGAKKGNEPIPPGEKPNRSRNANRQRERAHKRTAYGEQKELERERTTSNDKEDKFNRFEHIQMTNAHIQMTTARQRQYDQEVSIDTYNE